MPTRRGFLGALLTGLAGAVIGAELDVDKLLWVPGAKTFFLPPVVEDVEDFNSFVTPDWVARESLRILNNRLAFVNRMYDDAFNGKRASIGDTVTVRLPQRFEQRASGLYVPVSLTAGA